jgi:hypothetical protein
MPRPLPGCIVSECDVMRSMYDVTSLVAVMYNTLRHKGTWQAVQNKHPVNPLLEHRRANTAVSQC